MEIREPNQEEKNDFIPLVTPSQGNYISPTDRFSKKIAEERLKAQEKSDSDGLPLPFADGAAREEWQSSYDEQIKEQKKKYGFVKPEEIKPFNADWKKFSDLKNFDLLESGERLDDQISKRYAKTITLKYKVYQFKGHYKRYTVMEDGIRAVERVEREAAKKLK